MEIAHNYIDIGIVTHDVKYNEKKSDSISLGRSDITTENGMFITNSIIIGNEIKAKSDQIIIGDEKYTYDKITIGNVNISELEERIMDLENLVEKQNELIMAMYYHPGMPGFKEAYDQFKSHSQSQSQCQDQVQDQLIE